MRISALRLCRGRAFDVRGPPGRQERRWTGFRVAVVTTVSLPACADSARRTHGRRGEPLRSEGWTHTTLGVPDREHAHILSAWDVVNVIASSLEQEPPRLGDRRLSDLPDLRLGLRRDPDRQTHRRCRSSSTIEDAGRSRPASADCQDSESASCSARRSLSLRSSPPSSATSSRTVPSGRLPGVSYARAQLHGGGRAALPWLQGPASGREPCVRYAQRVRVVPRRQAGIVGRGRRYQVVRVEGHRASVLRAAFVAGRAGAPGANARAAE
jgi:hypothetical protein